MLKNLGVLLLLISILMFGCGDAKENESRYKNRIGYIDPETSRYSENFKLCNEDSITGYYSSYAPKIYKNHKYTFRKYIQENYQNRDFKATGFLNLRFHINCEGQIGNLEVNELDENLELSNLNDDLVEQLLKLSIHEDNWNSFQEEGINSDIYMYLIFKIENGNILEILP